MWCPACAGVLGQRQGHLHPHPQALGVTQVCQRTALVSGSWRKGRSLQTTPLPSSSFRGLTRPMQQRGTRHITVPAAEAWPQAEGRPEGDQARGGHLHTWGAKQAESGLAVAGTPGVSGVQGQEVNHILGTRGHWCYQHSLTMNPQSRGPVASQDRGPRNRLPNYHSDKLSKYRSSLRGQVTAPWPVEEQDQRSDCSRWP